MNRKRPKRFSRKIGDQKRCSKAGRRVSKRIHEYKLKPVLVGLKNVGNAFYSSGDFDNAVRIYNKGLKLCMFDTIDKATLLENRAAAYLKLGRYQKVIDDTTEALLIRPNYIEALYHRCHAHEHLGRHDDAINDAKAADILVFEKRDLPLYIRKLLQYEVYIDSLPDEIILKIFSYLRQDQLGQIARVCKSWNMLTKTPALWKEVDVKLLWRHVSQDTLANFLVNSLKLCTTSIRLDFFHPSDWTGGLNFQRFCERLQEKCPHLKVLILESARLSHSLPSVIDLCSQFLQDVKILVFHSVIFPYCPTKRLCGGDSKVEVLHLILCDAFPLNKPPFSKMPHLKSLSLQYSCIDHTWFNGDTTFLNQLHELHLGGTRISNRLMGYQIAVSDPKPFQAVWKQGMNLEVLHLCADSYEVDVDFILKNSSFPCLKTICLVLSRKVTCEGVISLIQSCPSLQNVYVSDDVFESYIAHPFVLINRCKLEIVKMDDSPTYSKKHSINVCYKK